VHCFLLQKILSLDNWIHCKALLRVGIFSAFTDVNIALITKNRDFLRKKGYLSTFISTDYLDKFLDDQEKSFKLIRHSHIQLFFIPPKDVGRGGMVSEIEEYVREVFPRRGLTGYLVVKTSYDDRQIKECVSSVILPYVRAGKLGIINWRETRDISRAVEGRVNKLFFEILRKNPLMLVEDLNFRLKCQICKQYSSEYICLEKCDTPCEYSHICTRCFHVDPLINNGRCHKDDLYIIQPTYPGQKYTI
jgi:hypothetical protein